MDVLESVIAKIEAGDHKAALDTITDPANDAMIKVQTMDLISVIATYLSDDQTPEKPGLYNTVESLLIRLAQKCNPREVLFEMIEKVATATSDEVFTSLLKVAQVAILRLPAKNARCLEWVLNTIMKYIDGITLPEFLDKDVQEEEELLLENDKTVCRLLQLYLTMHLFLEPIAKHLDQPSENVFFDTNLTQKNAVICCVLQLMGKLFPLLHLPRSEQRSRIDRRLPFPAAESYSLQVAKSMTALILLLVKDPLFLLPYGEKRATLGRQRNKAVSGSIPDGDDQHPSSNDCFLDKTQAYTGDGLAVLFYLLLGEEMLPASVPQIYDPRYIFETGLYHVVQLFNAERYRAVVYFKGIRLAEALVRKLGDTQRLTANDLDAPIHSMFCKRMIRALERSASVRNREIGLTVLTQYIHAFDDEGRYTIIAFMLTKFENDSVKSFAISLYKNLVCEAIRQSGPTEPLSRWYSGDVLKEMLTKHICCLREGVKTDLLDNSCTITSAISTLMVLLKTDHRANLTSIWDYFDCLEKQFLLELRKALDLSKAHYKTELQATVDGCERPAASEQAPELALSALNGEMPPALTKEKRVELYEQMILRLDMMDFHMARLNGDIDQIREKRKNVFENENCARKARIENE